MPSTSGTYVERMREGLRAYLAYIRPIIGQNTRKPSGMRLLTYFI